MKMSQPSNPAVYALGPCGPPHAQAFSMDITYDQNPKLKIIYLKMGDGINGMKVVYQTNGQEATIERGELRGEVEQMIIFEEDEVLMAVSGTYTNSNIRSLVFVTNKRTYSNFGTPSGASFTLSAPKGFGEIVGFHGRADSHIIAIGVLIKPIVPFNPELAISEVGACGWINGTTYHMNLTYDQNPKIKSIHVRSGDSVERIKVVYQVNGQVATTQFGASGGDEKTITFEQDEVLIAVSGNYVDKITMIEFVTNKKTYGPYGRPSGPSFNLAAPKGLAEIVGFYGLAWNNVFSIGVLIRPFVFIKPDESQPVPTRTFRIQNLDANLSSLSVTITGVVTLLPSNSSDKNQEWYKDKRYSQYKDKDGQPGFALIHKQTGKYLILEGNNLALVSVETPTLQKTALWTVGPWELRSGFRDIRNLADRDLVLNNARNSTHSVNVTRVTRDYKGSVVNVADEICWLAF